ncbi:MAG TPA: hypothetical protein VGF70_11960 [Solirubrobacteraceae bacterium]
MKRRFTVSAATLALACSVALILAAVALVGTVGADARWLAALGHVIVSRHTIPSGVPFAAGASSHWPNVPVLAELLFHWLDQAFGDRGLVLAQLLAVAIALGFLILDSRSGQADDAGTSRALLLAGLGSISALAIARSQLFSLALFPVLCCLLRAEVRTPSWRIWLALPLLALWSNLHGAVLVGWGVLVAYAVLSRLRSQPLVSIGLVLGGAVAIGATPALLRTVDYYQGVLGNQAAATGQGLWGSLSLSSPLDLAFIACAAVLAVQFLRSHPQVWELAAAAGLALLAIQAGRSGIWLTLFVVPTAARSFVARRQWRALTAPVAVACAGLLVVGLVRGPRLEGAGRPLLTRALVIAHGSPVLAAGAVEEQVALAGGRVVAGDPIDAFPARTQTAYLDWLDGSRRGLSELDAGVRVVLVMRGSRAQHLMAKAESFALAGSDAQVLLYERTAAA